MNGRPDPDRADHAADDDAWRDLVARLRGGETGLEADGPAPAEPSAAERAAAAEAGLEAGRAGNAPDPAQFSDFDPLGLSRPSAVHRLGRGPVGEEPDEHVVGDFVPEEPKPILAGADPAVVLAWCGALGGPLALLVFALVWRAVPGFVIALLIAAFVAGVGVLIMRLPRHKEDDGDDGARV
ncbi:hypothetical protein [Sinomonas flava]|uniref:Uncharacterized protein n=1 Tax=Sinomonas flava TaxID=496857 RepID=A0ABP5NAF8_9MICC